MPAGRPSKWEDRFIDLAWEYIEKHEAFGDPVPTVEGLACECGVGKQAIYDWAEEHREFSHALVALKAKQGRLLQAKGLKNETNPAITKLMLSANHGMAEKSDVTSDGEKIQAGIIYLPSKKPEGDGANV